MILSDRDIKQSVADGRITIQPYDEKCVQPASYDLHLDKDFLVFNRGGHAYIDVKKPVDDYMKKVTITEEEPFILHPGEFVLGKVLEKTGVARDMVGRLEGKSSLGRLGIIVHATAGYLDPGNELNMTLELSNIGSLPVMLYYRMPIAQMAFEPLSSEAEHAYGEKTLNSKYKFATEPQASQMWKNFNNGTTSQN